jgi:hypothetical protein
VSKAGVIMSNETNVYTQIGFQNIFAANMPVFACFRDSGRTGAYKTNMQADSIANLPAPAALAIRPLPPVSQWVSVHTLGAKGGDSTDDTAAIQKRPGVAVSVRVLAARLAAASRRVTFMAGLQSEGGTG